MLFIVIFVLQNGFYTKLQNYKMSVQSTVQSTVQSPGFELTRLGETVELVGLSLAAFMGETLGKQHKEGGPGGPGRQSKGGPGGPRYFILSSVLQSD